MSVLGSQIFEDFYSSNAVFIGPNWNFILEIKVVISHIEF